MKLIRGNVSLFSHLVLGACLLLPAPLAQPRGWMMALGEPRLGKNVKERAFRGWQAKSEGLLKHI